jgi:predicted nucleic acid-binding protein
VTTPDSSVVIAAFARWHDQHGPAARAVGEADTLVAHVALESYSVLTRLPPPRRASPGVVAEFLGRHFGGRLAALDAGGYESLLALAAASGITGGATYDALVAASAKAAGATLLTLDARATAAYDALGADYRLLA